MVHNDPDFDLGALQKSVHDKIKEKLEEIKKQSNFTLELALGVFNYDNYSE